MLERSNVGKLSIETAIHENNCYVKVTIRRLNLFEDALGSLSKLGSRLRGRIMVTFVDNHGMEEPGMDLGGLMMEMVEEVMKAGLDPGAGLFQANADSLLYPSPLAEHLPYGPLMLKFLGIIKIPLNF